jgi:hypothetical protein
MVLSGKMTAAAVLVAEFLSASVEYMQELGLIAPEESKKYKKNHDHILDTI